MRFLPPLFALAAVAVPAVAAAQVRATLSIDAPDPSGARPPDVRAAIDGLSRPPAPDQVALTIDGVTVAARAVDTAAEPVSIIVVFETQHLWIGNADWIMESDTPDERNKSEGFHKPLVAAIDGLAGAGPAGS